MKLPNEVEQDMYTASCKTKSFPRLIQPHLIRFSFSSVNTRTGGIKTGSVKPVSTTLDLV